MMFEGTIQNGVVVLDLTEVLPERTRVEVLPQRTPDKKSALRERLLSLAGTADDLLADMAKNHDHYIHGAPKRRGDSSPTHFTSSLS